MKIYLVILTEHILSYSPQTTKSIESAFDTLEAARSYIDEMTAFINPALDYYDIEETDLIMTKEGDDKT